MVAVDASIIQTYMASTTPARKGVFTFYPDKERDPVTINLTAEANLRMTKAQRATEASRGALLEHAFRKLMGMPLNDDLDVLIRQLKR